MPNLPSGTVTFVFSDIEGSTSLLKQLGDDGYSGALATHRQLVRSVFADHEGEEIDTQGDAFFYSFVRARAAVAAAVAVQRAHARQNWPDGAELRVRLGLHTGEPAVGEGGYTGLDVVRASRIAASARGGQVLMSETTRSIVANHLPNGVTLRQLGARKLKDIDEPESVAELVIPEVPVTPEPSSAGVRRETGNDPPPTFGQLVGVPDIDKDMPAWLSGLAGRFLPPTHRAIEERVLADLGNSMRERAAGKRAKHGAERRASAPPPALKSGRKESVADEIAKLRELRDSGALTDDQYERAVERTLSSAE